MQPWNKQGFVNGREQFSRVDDGIERDYSSHEADTDCDGRAGLV